MKRWILALVSLPLLAQSPRRITLDEAEQLALRSHPSLDAARLNAAAAAELPSQLRSGLLPTINANLTGAGAPDDTRIAAGAINNPVIYSRLATGLSINQLILDFGRTRRLIEASSLRAQAEQANSAVASQQVLLQVRQAYFAGLRTEAVLRVAEETVRARQLVVDQVQALTEAKLKSGLDLSFAQVALSEAKLLLASALNQRRAADTELAAALSEPSDTRFELVELPLPADQINIPSELVAEALRQRPEITARRLEAEAAERQVQAEGRLRYPTLSAIGSFGAIPGRAEGLARSEYAAVGLNLSLPLWNGGLFKSRQTEASLRFRAAQRRIAESERNVSREVSLTLLNLDTARQRLDLAQELSNQATQALDLAQARYDLGLSSIVELSQAQLGKTQADIQQATARYEYLLQRYILAYQVGR